MWHYVLCRLMWFHNGMRCIHIIWVRSTSLTNDHDVALFHNHLHAFIDSMYPNNSSRIKYHVIRPKLPGIGLRILEISNLFSQWNTRWIVEVIYQGAVEIMTWHFSRGFLTATLSCCNSLGNSWSDMILGSYTITFSKSVYMVVCICMYVMSIIIFCFNFCSFILPAP